MSVESTIFGGSTLGVVAGTGAVIAGEALHSDGFLLGGGALILASVGLAVGYLSRL